MEGQSSDRNSRTVLFSACTSEESLRDCKRKSASLVQGRRTIMPIGGKHDAFDPDLPVSASLLLGNLATLQETYLHRYECIVGSWPCALCHKWRSVLRNSLTHGTRLDKGL
jgi:hypothetical protein